MSLKQCTQKAVSAVQYDMRLINADAVEKQAYDDVHYHAELEDWEFDVVTHYLDHAPTIDAVPVVRCKDCKHKRHLQGATDDAHVCGLGWGLRGVVAEEDFCSYGEWKEADGNG